MLQTVFDAAMAQLMVYIPTLVTNANSLEANVISKSANCDTQAAAASTSAGAALTSQNAALASQNAAAASAASSLTAPGTNATSATSMTVGSGAKAFTLAQTGKSFVVGQWVSVCDSATPTANWMLGGITAFNAGTGAITVNVTVAAGTLTGTSWVVAAAAPVSVGSLPVTTVAGTAQTAAAGNHYLMTNAAVSVLTLPPNPSANDEVWVTFTNGLYTNSVARNTKTIYGDALDFTVNAGVLLTWKFKYLNTDWKTV